MLPLLQAPSFLQPPSQLLLYEPEAAFRQCPICPSSGLSSKPRLKAPPSSHLDVLVSAPYTCPSSLGATLNHQPESGNHPFRVLASPSSSHLLFSLPQLTSQLPPHHQIHLLARLQVLGMPCLPPRGTPSLCQRWANSYSFGKASGQVLSSRSPSCAPPPPGGCMLPQSRGLVTQARRRGQQTMPGRGRRDARERGGARVHVRRPPLRPLFRPGAAEPSDPRRASRPQVCRRATTGRGPPASARACALSRPGRSPTFRRQRHAVIGACGGANGGATSEASPGAGAACAPRRADGGGRGALPTVTSGPFRGTLPWKPRFHSCGFPGATPSHSAFSSMGGGGGAGQTPPPAISAAPAVGGPQFTFLSHGLACSPFGRSSLWPGTSPWLGVCPARPPRGEEASGPKPPPGCCPLRTPGQGCDPWTPGLGARQRPEGWVPGQQGKCPPPCSAHTQPEIPPVIQRVPLPPSTAPTQPCRIPGYTPQP